MKSVHVKFKCKRLIKKATRFESMRATRTKLFNVNWKATLRGF